MKRLTIRWDGEAAAEALRELRGSETGLSECLSAARGARTAMVEARPDDRNQIMGKLIAEYDATVKAMEDSKRSLEELIRGTERARQEFEEASSQVDRLVESLGATGKGAAAGWTGARQAGQGLRLAWEVPRPIVMPGVNARLGPMVPNWLEAYLNDRELFREWM